MFRCCLSRTLNNSFHQQHNQQCLFYHSESGKFFCCFLNTFTPLMPVKSSFNHQAVTHNDEIPYNNPLFLISWTKNYILSGYFFELYNCMPTFFLHGVSYLNEPQYSKYLLSVWAAEPSGVQCHQQQADPSDFCALSEMLLLSSSLWRASFSCEAAKGNLVNC